MTRSRLLLASAAVLLGTLAACSDTPEATAPAPATPPTSATPTFTSMTPPTTSEPPSPTVANLPDEGRKFASCKDGRCRVHVKVGDRIPVPERFDATMIVLKEIKPGSVSIDLPRSDGGKGSYTFFDPEHKGALISGGKVILAFPAITGGEAIMQVDV